jgi:predicted O-linked N-acetylglucosamine transferase (SPINDLY family)
LIWKKQAEAFGVEASRLIFCDAVDWEAHVQRGGLADVFLDTTAYNAHSTGCNSLWASVPIVT